jgi:hypothetical protein
MFEIVLAAAAVAASTETDVLANVQAGRMICSNPDDATHTCSTISKYQVLDDRSLLETSEILFSPDQPISFEVQAHITLKNGAICGAMLKADLDKGIVRVSGRPIAADKNQAVLAKLDEEFAPLYGRQTCEVIRIEGGRLLKFGQMDGVDIPLPPKPVRWISPDDGFKVAPPA